MSWSLLQVPSSPFCLFEVKGSISGPLKGSPQHKFLTYIGSGLLAAIAICDLAEILGSTLTIYLLVKILLFWGVLITGLDVMMLLLLQGKGVRWLEAIVSELITTFNPIIALIEAFLINSTILILVATTFHTSGNPNVALIREDLAD